MRDLHVGRSSQSSHRSAVAGHQIRTANATTCRERASTPTASPCWWRCYTGMATSIFWRTICIFPPSPEARRASPDAIWAIVGALASAAKSKAIGRTTCAIGEISLTGQVRPVPRLEYRLREAARLGFTTAVVPTLRREIAIPGLSIVQVDTIAGCAWRHVAIIHTLHTVFACMHAKHIHYIIFLTYTSGALT